MKTLFVVMAVALLLLVVSCSSGPVLDGTSWTLEAMGSGENPPTVSMEPPITLEFQDAGRMEGLTGCNSYTGTYELDGSDFRVGFSITEAGCPTDELGERERAYKRTLADAQRIALDGSALIIETEDGKTLKFGLSP